MNCARAGLFGVGAALAVIAALCTSPAVAAAGDENLEGTLSLPAGTVLLAWGGATILRSTDGHGWSRATTPATANLSRIASNADGSVLVAAGQSTTLLRSMDVGLTWRAVPSVKVKTDLRTVVNLPGTKIWLAAGTQGRILRSTDNGKHWKLVESRLSAELWVLHYDPITTALLIGGEQGLIGISRDQGQSWQVTSITMPAPATPVSSFQRFGLLLLATSTNGRFLISSDGAQTWDLLQASTDATFTGAAWDPVHSSIVLTGHNGDVLRSADHGQTWEGGEISFGGRKSHLSAIYFDARSQSLLVTGHDGVMARSSDGGKSWLQASSDLRGELRGLIEYGGKLVVFGANGVIAVSSDSGTSWTPAR